MKLRYSMGMFMLMAPAVLRPEWFAAGKDTEAWKCLIYMFGHADALHYLINGLGWLMMWKVATWSRTITAWAISALAVWIMAPETPVIGWSGIIFYYLGLCMRGMKKSNRIKLMAITAAGFMMPHIAAGIHVTMLIAGWIGRKMELAWEKTK